MGYGLMGYNDNRQPSAKAIAEENERMRLRQQHLRIAAEHVVAELAKIQEVRRVVLFGSVAAPLFEEIPRFRQYRIHRVTILHECKDVDIAVWIDDLSCLKALQKARGKALNDLMAEQNIGVAHHQLDTFIINSGTGDYMGNLCSYGTCPKDKKDCLVQGCGQTPFLKVYEDFILNNDALSPEKTVVLYGRDETIAAKGQS